jgi:hypothetical protein
MPRANLKRIDIAAPPLYPAGMTDNGSASLTVGQALRLAAAAQRDGRGDKAASIYTQILANDPDNGDALHLMGLLEAARGRPRQAEPLLRRAVEKFPEIPAFKASLAKALHDLGRIDEGIGHAAAALAAAPNDKGVRDVVNRVLRVEPSIDMLQLPPRPEPAQAEPAPPAGETLVAGVATGYAVAALRPFVLSLREHYGGPVHLFVDETEAITALLEQHGIDWSPMTTGASHPVIHRFSLYRDLIGGLGNRTRVLLTDVADVIFQGNPFGFSVEAPLVGALEDASMTIGSCPWNKDWIGAHFGRAMLERLAAHPISCVGTILGDRAGLTDYLTQFCLLAGSLPVDGIYGLDTAIHNVLIHHRTIAGTAVLENGWPIATVQHMPEPSIGIVDKAIALSDGRRPLLVHQYNRRASMIELVNGHYGPD